MEGVLHQVLSGIASGGIYASVALALVMIYQATHHVNFAQGEMATLSTYIALTLINLGLPYWVAFVLTIVVSFVIGLLIERILMRPMMDAPVLASVGVFIGLLLIINSSTGWMFDYMGHRRKPWGRRGGSSIFWACASAPTNWCASWCSMIRRCSRRWR